MNKINLERKAERLMKIIVFSDYAWNNHRCVCSYMKNISMRVELLSLFLVLSLHLCLGTECSKRSLLNLYF